IPGSISVSSSPVGANIYLDGANKGTITPAVLTGITPGTHTVKLIKNGYYPWFGTVIVAAEATAVVTAAMTIIIPGSISVSSSPVGANIYLDGANKGTITPAALTGIFPGTHTVKLTKNGYYNWFGTVIVPAEATTVVTVILTTVIPGSISVTSIPDGAVIYLNGASKGTVTPFILTGIIPDMYTIKLTKRGYYDWFGTVTVLTNATTDVTADMTIIIPGSISVSSSPDGADIYLDGTSTGTITPAALTGITPGMHTIKLTKRGYYDWFGTVIVAAETTADVSAAMDIIIPGSISVTSTPAGADIYLDGTSTGTITPAALTGITPGTHTIKLTKREYYDWFGRPIVSAEKTASVFAVLPRIPGSILINSNPAGANIYIDKMSKGTITPAILRNLTPGTHTIKLTRSGYYDMVGTVIVIAKKTTHVSVFMTPITGFSIRTTPAGANIYIDKMSKGRVTPAILGNITPGTHTIKLTKKGYCDIFGIAIVTAKKITYVSVTMTPITGFSITSTPAGANIYIDRMNKGRVTPAILGNITPGTHTINLTKKGYCIWSGTATVSAKQTINVFAAMTMLGSSTILKKFPAPSMITTNDSFTLTIALLDSKQNLSSGSTPVIMTNITTPITTGTITIPEGIGTAITTTNQSFEEGTVTDEDVDINQPFEGNSNRRGC
ncbi:PEGA domain-containing protein, partial [Candidatus Desantisbacteria bacterium]|nr:PEGA domain-containing protein [Candidatus Desantisbacteria bacterium]